MVSDLRKAFFGVGLALVAALLLPAASLAAAPAPIAMVRLEGAIDVPSAGYLERALQEAQRQRSQCLLILLNTPGGLGDPMEKMTSALLNAPIPTVAYVYPAGAHAWSAGTFITMAASVAAMHPATSIGAAHPVELFGTPKLPETPPGEPGKAKPPPPLDVMGQKVENAFAEQAKVIAAARGRNTAWAEKAVRLSITGSAEEAVKLNVVDLLADDVNDLLEKLDGRRVALPGKREVTLRTAGAPVVEIPRTVRESFFHVLADPNILLVLLILAGLGIMFELQNPGAILPGVIGGLCLLLALYSMAALPVNYAGVGLIVFAMLLFLAEVKVPSHGVLTVGGVISFVLGAMMLTNTSLAPALRVSWQVIVVMGVLLVLFFLFVIGAAVRAHMRKVRTGEEGMLRERGRALTRLAPLGTVLVEGERWQARSLDGDTAEGEEVEVMGREGLVLTVRKRVPDATKPG
ncbi:MAG: nodulation protein NfeD [Armatimonadota bacterium]